MKALKFSEKQTRKTKKKSKNGVQNSGWYSGGRNSSRRAFQENSTCALLENGGTRQTRQNFWRLLHSVPSEAMLLLRLQKEA